MCGLSDGCFRAGQHRRVVPVGLHLQSILWVCVVGIEAHVSGQPDTVLGDLADVRIVVVQQRFEEVVGLVFGLCGALALIELILTRLHNVGCQRSEP